MSNRTDRQKRLDLLDAISARLEAMGVPAICTLPSGKNVDHHDDDSVTLTSPTSKPN